MECTPGLRHIRFIVINSAGLIHRRVKRVSEAGRNWPNHTVFLLQDLNILLAYISTRIVTIPREPRLTIDVDIVVDMKLQHVRPFIAAFPEADYYLSEAAIRDSMRRRFPFNVIQTKTGAKADIIPLPDDVFSRIAFNRRRKMAYRGDGQEAYFISAEDVILAKLFTFAETQSDKHLRDIRGVLVTQWGELNLALIRRAADHRGLLDQFEQIYEAARQEVED